MLTTEIVVTSPRNSALTSRSSSFGMLGIHGEALCRVFGPQLTRLKDGSLSSVDNPPLDVASQYIAAQVNDWDAKPNIPVN